MRDLNRYVVCKYASQWDDIAIELGLGEKITIIKRDNYNGGCEDCFKTALWKWLESTPHATWKMLEAAITNVEKAKLSLDPITDIYGENTNHVASCMLFIIVVHT